MTLDLTKPVQTRDGHKARIICTDRNDKAGQPVVALVKYANGREDMHSYTLDGFYYVSRNPHGLDLINVPESVPESLESRVDRLEDMLQKVIHRLHILQGDK